jgi:drug/metabolite transporter (DMT)-like permease
LLSALLPLSAGALWGAIGLFVRRLNAFGIAEMDVVALRVLTAAILFVPMAWLHNRSSLRIHFRDVWCFAGLGIGSIVFFNYCYFTTMSRASLSVAATLLYSAPAMVLVLSALLFHEKLSVRKCMACLLAFLGCALASGWLGADRHLPLPTFLTGLGSGFGFALFSLFGRCALNRGYRSATLTAYTFVFASLGTLPFLHPEEVVRVFRLHPDALAWGIGLGVVSTLLPYWLYAAGLRRMDNGKASLLGAVEPVVATLIGLAVFHEPLTRHTLAGILLVLGSLLVLSLPCSRQPLPSASGAP